MVDPRAPSYEDLEPEGEPFDEWAGPEGSHGFLDDEYEDEYEMAGLGPLGDFEFDDSTEYGGHASYNELGEAGAQAEEELPYREEYTRRGRGGFEGFFNDEGYTEDRNVPQPRDAVATQAARTALAWGSRAAGGAHLKNGGRNRRSHERTEALLEACSASVRESHELMNALASAAAATNNKAEAMGLAAAMVPIAVGLAPHEYRALWSSVPTLVQGIMGVGRLLHQRSATRGSIKLLPMILQNTIAQLAGRVARGYPVSQKTAAKALASETRAVLSQHRRSSTKRRRSRRYRMRGNDFN